MGLKDKAKWTDKPSLLDAGGDPYQSHFTSMQNPSVCRNL